MSEPYIGEIKMFGGTFAPRGYAFCNGQLLSIAQNTALFSILGTTYGGDGITTFGLPDLRSRSPVHWGNQAPAGLTPIAQGQTGGAENVTITTPQLPPHIHAVTSTGDVNVVAAVGNKRGSVLNYLASDASGDQMYHQGPTDGQLGAGSITVTSTCAPTGGGGPLPVRSPFLAVSFIIATVGVFPTRN